MDETLGTVTYQISNLKVGQTETVPFSIGKVSHSVTNGWRLLPAHCLCLCVTVSVLSAAFLRNCLYIIILPSFYGNSKSLLCIFVDVRACRCGYSFHSVWHSQYLSPSHSVIATARAVSVSEASISQHTSTQPLHWCWALPALGGICINKPSHVPVCLQNSEIGYCFYGITFMVLI